MKFSKLGPILAIFLLAGLTLAACSGSLAAGSAAVTPDNEPVQPDVQVSDIGKDTTAPEPAMKPGAWVEQVPRVDEQGAVVVEIVPVKLNDAGSTINFDVSMNTHSVDLSMDLANLAILSTDTGKSVQASLWDAPGGGHHVSGKLSFPAGVNGERLLEGATKLTLTLKNVDAPERVFVWEK